MRTSGLRWTMAGSLLLAALAGGAPAAGGTFSAEQQAVVDVVTSAYVDGIHNFRDPVAIRKGFHPDFEMLILKDGKLEKLPIAKWIERIEAQNLKEPPPTDGKRSTFAAFPSVEVTGSAAVARVELNRDGRLVFTDYLSLYRFADGWKIVGKIFYRHP